MTLLAVQAFSHTDRGQVREGNEDNLFRGESIFAVADGMGGHQAGEVASETAIDVVRGLDGATFGSVQEAENGLVAAIKEANRQVVAKAASDPGYRGMGTTLTAVIVANDRLHLAHVGDSRAYLLREGELTQLTTDHTLVEQLVREGRLSRDEAAVHPQRSVITRAIGVDERVDVDTLPSLELQPGDQVLLCSDGLTGPLSDAEVAEILVGQPDGARACRALVQAANDAGGPDNITVVLLRVERADAAGAAGAGGRTASNGAAPGDLHSANDGSSRLHRWGPGPLDEDTDEPDPDTADREAADPAQEHRPSRARRVLRALGALVMVLLLLGGAAAAGLYLLSRSWFVGESNGAVVIANGVPQQLAGIPLYRVIEETELRADQFPVFRADRLRAGISVDSLEDARRTVDELRVAPDRLNPVPSPTVPPQPRASPAPVPDPAGPAVPPTP